MKTKHPQHRHVQILMVALAVSAAANVLPFMARAQLGFSWSPQSYGYGYEYWCNGRPQATPCSSSSSSIRSSVFSSSSRLSSSSANGFEYWCNGRPQATPCSSSSSSSVSSAASSACVSSTPPPAIDLSALLDSEQHFVGPNEPITYTVKVRNNSQDTAHDVSVWMLRNDMKYLDSTVYCFVQDSDSTYVRCNVPIVPAGESATFTVTMLSAPEFTCIDSTGGRSVFAFVRALTDHYPQNNTSNIINTMPVCR